MRITIFFVMYLLLFGNVYAKELFKKTGTFSSLYYHKEAGDLLGDEIRIVVGKEKYEGTFQSVQGEPDHLVLLENISFNGNKIEFTIPEKSIFTGKFVGRLSAYGLEGTLILTNGVEVNLRLKRRKSYWD